MTYLSTRYVRKLPKNYKIDETKHASITMPSNLKLDLDQIGKPV